MARNQFGLGFLFTAEDRASPVMNKVDKNYRKLDRATEKTQKNTQAAQGAMMVGTATMAAGVGGLAVAFQSAKAAGEFEQVIAKVGAITGASAKDLEDLSAAAIQAGLDTQFSPKESAEGLAELGVRGLNAAESMQAFRGALDLAAGGQIGIAQASSTTASALRVFSLEADQAGVVADKLLKISNVTALQANDLENALGTVSRGAGLTKQSIDEMLPSIGLVKNTGVDASVAANAVSSALTMMAKNADKFKAVGVSVTDAQGKFRPFMDVVMDTTDALSKYTNDAERVAIATELYSRFGVTAYQAVSSQLTTGIRNANGEIIKGAEAMQFLRDSMAGAEGTAAKFREALLDTLPGQLVLLKGTVETLAVTLGQPLAEALEPVVNGIRIAVNQVIELFQKLPPQMQKMVGVALVVGSALLALGGVILVVAGTVAVAGPAIASFVSALVTAAPAIAGIGAALAGIGAVMGTLYAAFQKNLGGLATRLRPIIERVQLFFEGLFQFMEDGFFSGDVAKKLSRPENAPVLMFLTVLIKWGHRVQRFIEGLKAGFMGFVEEAFPVFQSFGQAVNKVAEAFRIVGSDADNAMGPSERFMKIGTTIGRIVARVLTIVINLLSAYLSMWAGWVKGVRAGFVLLSPFFTQIREAFADIGEAISTLMQELGIMDAQVGTSTGFFEGLGKVIGFITTTVLGPMLAVFTAIVRIIQFWVEVVVGAVRLVKSVFAGLILFFEGFGKLLNGDIKGAFKAFGEGLESIFGGYADYFMSVFNAVAEQINNLLDLLADVAAQLPESVRPEFLDDFISARRSRDTAATMGQLDADFEQQMGQQFAYANVPTVPYQNNIAGAAEKEASSRAAAADGQAAALRAVLSEANSKTTETTQVVQLVVDGEALGQATLKGQKKASALSFGGDASAED